MEQVRPVLQVKDLYVYRGGEPVIVDARFTVNSGDYVGIVGPNGGGKTTLIKAILGILPHREGTIHLFGRPIKEFDEWSKLAYISQDAIFFDSHFPLNVRELVSLGRINKGNLGRRLKPEDREIVVKTMDMLGISDIADRRIGNLSGGQKQRVFVAKAMVRNPEVLILDEPVTGIDFEAQKRFYMKLSNLGVERGTTILHVSHDLAAVFCRMNKVLGVNRRVYASEIDLEVDPNTMLRKAYGDHFHFAFHKHLCEGLFEVE
jgi:zinc transport system ATP-binding protein